ncbi:hypothetical protein FOZ63_002561, partial [Perkinsus olseni]
RVIGVQFQQMRFTLYSAFIALLQPTIAPNWIDTVHGPVYPGKFFREIYAEFKASLKDFDWDVYANGRGHLVEPGKFKCFGKWKDAVVYGARKQEIKELCVRLHEKQQDDWEYKDSPADYNCILDPNDEGNDHGRKNRDWLCYEKTRKWVLLPPHGPSLDPDCPVEGLDFYAPRWYPYQSPPPWCTYSWSVKYQTCYC